MGKLREIAARIRGLFVESRFERELDEELNSHLELLVEENLRHGMSSEQARREARRSFGGVAQTKEAYRDQRGLPIVETLVQDIRYGGRLLRKNPSFTAVAIITLALCIGANTAIFSVVSGILLRPLPYSDPDRLVRLMQSYAQRGLSPWNMSQMNFATYREQSRSFEALAAISIGGGANLTGSGEPERIQLARVTADFFQVFEVEPILGRTFRPEEETPGKNGVCVLSYSFWQRRFGGDADVVGRTLLLNDVATEVVGVMPDSFDFPERWPSVALWTPIALNPQRQYGFFLRGIGRLKPGVSPAEAEAETTAILWNSASQNPGFAGSDSALPADADLKTMVTPLKKVLTGDTENPLLVLLCASGLLLLIGSANVANLLLAKGALRTREIAVRMALGATPNRIVRQLLTESVLLAMIGGAGGALLAWWGVRLLVRLGIQGVPRLAGVSLDTTVLAFSLTVIVVTGLLCGLAPARQAYSLGLEAGLREGARGTTKTGHRRANGVLVAAQFALSLLLLVGVGLLLRSFQNLITTNTGFRPENVFSMIVSLPDKRYDTEERSIQFNQSLVERVSSLPGIVRAASVDGLPMTGDDNADGFVVEGHEPGPGEVAGVFSVRVVSPGYFDVLGIKLLRGRDIEDADRRGSQLVAVVDEIFARRHWPSDDPVGKRIRYSWSKDWITIVGLVGGIKDDTLGDPPKSHVYLSSGQWPLDRFYLVSRTAGDPAAAVSAIRSEVQELDDALPVYSVQTMTQAMEKTLHRERLTNQLLMGFAGLAVLLAAAGIYGVMSLDVNSRVQEFGIRTALGARSRDVLRMVVGNGIRLALAGIAFGVVGATWLTRLLRSLLFEVTPSDPPTFAAAILLLAAVAVLACYIPARRATRVDPVIALRNE
ncbi:MAG TPA: ABC transporter permease [Blastocatellia bacterium]|nr:ABC transporter permease [Blastocatellia bacterium]